MPKTVKKVADDPKLPHEIAAENLERDLLKQSGKNKYIVNFYNSNF